MPDILGTVVVRVLGILGQLRLIYHLFAADGVRLDGMTCRSTSLEMEAPLAQRIALAELQVHYTYTSRQVRSMSLECRCRDLST